MRWAVAVLVGCAHELPPLEPLGEFAAEPAPLAGECSDDELALLIAPATEDAQDYSLRCSATVPAGAVISKRVIIDASGVTLACNGASIDARDRPWYSPNVDMIEIRSIDESPHYQRPEDVSVRGCTVAGSIRIFGMCRNGQDCPAQRASSQDAGHTQRARDAAPRRISLDGMHITGNRRIPVYFSPGVTQSSLTSSTVDGGSVKGALYLDAESDSNTISDNAFFFDTDSDGNEPSAPLIAIDGSSNNTIANNYFSGLDEGGIYLYRNCGELGTARWNTPSNNRIANNTFYYRTYDGPNPAVFLGSRGPGYAGYCDEDDAIPGGSGDSDLDFATDNVVVENQLYTRDVADMIKIGTCQRNAANYCPGSSGNTGNLVEDNAGGLPSN